MTNKLAKYMFSLGLAAAMTLAGASAVFADGIDTKAEEATKRLMSTELMSTELWADFTPSVSEASIEAGFTSANITWSGIGRNFKVYLNDSVKDTRAGQYDTSSLNDQNGSETVTYTAKAGEYSYYINNLQPGTTYSVQIVPTDKDDREYLHAAVTKNVTTLSPSVTEVSAHISSAPLGDDENGYSGFSQVQVYLNWTGEDLHSNGTSYEILRSASRNSGYKRIAMTTVIGYYDSSVEYGKTYYYKVRPYIDSTAYTLSRAVSVSISEFAGTADIVLNEKNQPVIICSSNGYEMGYDIYRSVKPDSDFKKIATICDDRYTDTSAKSGNLYYYKVVPYTYDADNKKYSKGTESDVQGVDLSFASGSMELEGEMISRTKAKLSWKEVSGAAGYDVYRIMDLTGAAYKYLGSIKKTTCTVKNLTADQGYTFVVQAYNMGGQNVKTNFIRRTVYVNTGAHAPDVRVTKRTFKSNDAKDTITVNNVIEWERVYGIKGFYVEEYDAGTGSYIQVKKLKASATSCKYKQTFSAGSASATSIRIVAYKGSRRYASQLDLDKGIGNVSSITVKKKGADGAVISWKAAPGADSYAVYRYTPFGGYIYLDTVSATSIEDKGLVAGVNYRYRISAHNSKLNLDNDNKIYGAAKYNYGEKTIYPGDIIFKLSPAAPTLSKVTSKTSGQAAVKWKKAGNATSYVIYRSTQKSKGYEKIGTAKKGETAYTDKSVKKGTTYYYKIAYVTKNDAGASVESARSSARSVKAS